MIRVLDELTACAIAAGEVIERPLSVVKELVENALDAGATRITVAVTRGGLDTIEVADDGAGIARAELALAFARHATSKLAAVDDLERIRSLGFRGEGLASIAAVARVRLVSRTASDDVAYAVDAHAGEVSPAEAVAAPHGTRVTVRALFSSVPARREYMRSPAAEFTRISTFLATLALGYPQVAFGLAHDGRPVFTFGAAAQLMQRLEHVFGPGPARALLAIEADASGGEGERVRVRGHVSTPGVDRADRRMQLLFVNGRLLRSTLLAGAWSGAYATFALAGRQPYGVLFVEVPPEHVDPNVHPTKSDVRLRDPEGVARAARRAIGATLGRNASARFRDAVSFAPEAERPAPAGGYRSEAFDWSSPRLQHPLPREASAAPTALRILAQLDATYLLATDGTALVLVDQHAAHERVAYEAILRQATSRAGTREPLLVPYTIELDGADAERFSASLETLAAAGLEAEPFGDHAFRITATPAGYGARRFDVRAYVDDLRDEVPGLGARERVWASLACHSVVRAGEALDVAEMAALLERLARCENPMHCPHGRPTMLRIEPGDLAKMFKR